MSKHSFEVLIIGDIIGQPGQRALVALLPSLKKKYSPNAIIVNAENSLDGFGLNNQIAQSILSLGVDVITSGNHIWHDKEIYPLLDSGSPILRPANYPSGAPGKGHIVVDVRGQKMGVLNVQGRIRMWPIDCPFKKSKELVRKMRQETNIIIVDMHADAPEEKEALAWHLDGEVSAVVGTHTHIQTADERVLPKGTAYMTDLGGSSPANSVIGFDFGISMGRLTTMIPLKNEVGKDAAYLRGALISIDPETGKALRIERFAELSPV